MTVETAGDRAVFFDTNEFAEVGQWFLGGIGEPFAVAAILERPDALVAIGSIEVLAPTYRARLRASELPVGAARGDRLVITATAEDFTVIKPLERDETRQIVVADLRPTGA